MSNTNCSTKIPIISAAFLSKEGNEILSSIKAPRYTDYINYLFGNVFKREYLDNSSFLTLSDFTDNTDKSYVNSGLVNLYNKVKEELINQINDPLFLMDSEISEAVRNSTSLDLIKILENWKLFVDFHSKYNSYVRVKEGELEDLKENNNYDKSGNEHSEFDLLTSQVRTVLKFLPKTQLIEDTNGQLKGIPVLNPLDGLPVRGDFENIFKLTLDALKGIKDSDKFLERLSSKEILYRIPELYFLFEILPVNGEQREKNLTKRQRLLFHDFYQVMSRDYIPVWASKTTYENNKLPLHIIFKSAKSNFTKIEDQFIFNFTSNAEENEYVKIDDDINEKNPELSSFGRKRLYALPEKLPLIDLSPEALDKLDAKKIKSNFKEYFNFLKLLGVEFSDFSLLSDKRKLIDILNHSLTLHDNLSDRLLAKQRLFSPLEDVQELKAFLAEDNKTKEKSVKKISPLRSIIKDIIQFEASISTISTSSVSKSPTGENQSDITYSNAISIAAYQINESSSLEELFTQSYFKKLKYNPLHKNSYVSNKVISNSNISYEIRNYSGQTTVIDEESVGKSTKNLSDVEKFKSDISNLLGWGYINTPQLEQKAGYFSLNFFDKKANKNILPFKDSMFTQDFITNSAFTAQILHYLHGEIERVKNYSKVKSYAPKAYGEFHIFKDFVKSKDILLDKNTVEYKKAEEQVLKNINDYFNKELSLLENFIKKNDIKDFVSEKMLSEAGVKENVFKDNEDYYKKNFLRTFIANDFVHNVEFGIFISGDPLYFEKNKNGITTSEYHKRLGGLSSTGTQPISTKNIEYFFNEDSEKIFWQEFSLRGVLNQFDKNPQERRDNSQTYLSGVLQENNVRKGLEYQKPETLENYIYSVKLKTGEDITKEQAEKDLKITSLKEKGIDVGDGQGYLNLDAARELSIKQGTYEPQQDVSYRFEALLFKEMLLEEKGEKLSEDDQKLLRKLEAQILRNPDKYGLPILKQTYFGTLSNESVEIDAKVFDKFALAILLPSVARYHPELKKLLLAMAKRQISYVKYESGTKGYVRNVFKNSEELGNEKNELDELESNLLKLQIIPPSTEKDSTKLATQMTKLLFTNLFDQGKSTGQVIALRDRFLSDLNTLNEFNKSNVLKKLGFTLDEDNKIASWDKENVINALIGQINLQKLPLKYLEALELDEKGDFLNTLESSGIYQQVLNYITGKLDSSLREFKVNGGDFVLLSESMFETPLRYSRLNKDKTSILSCDCRITLTKQFAKLLNLEDLENKGKTINTVERLNELLKLEKFREKYSKELTIVFSRPPVQGPNSMGTASVVEFFYPTAGNILQLPKEFMHQAGIDFDYDKEKVLIPSLSNEGIFISEENILGRIKALEEDNSELREIYDYYGNTYDLEDAEDYEDFKDLKNQITNENALSFLSKLFNLDISEIPNKLLEINEQLEEYFSLKKHQKAILNNNLLNTFKESLQLPEIYSELILPNTDTTVKPLALKNGQEIGNLNTLPLGVDVYSYLQNLKVFKLFNDAKNLLGAFALHNVFLELIAPLDVKAYLDYKIDKEKGIQRRVNRLLLQSDVRVVNVSSRTDFEGNNKQHITSEFINATVDSAKDPYFANFMLSFNNVNTFSFLMFLNYPVDLIVDFTSSAVVRRYLALRERGLNLNEAFTQTLSELEGKRIKNQTIEQALDHDSKILNQDNTELLKELKNLKLDDALAEPKYLNFNKALLANFLAMEEHSKQFSNLKNLFKNDTQKTSSLYEISSKKDLRNNVLYNGMFSKKDVESIENQSTMTPFRNDEIIGEVLKTVFPIMANPKVNKKLGLLFTQSKSSLSEIDKRILSQIITNDYITTILFSLGNYKNENFFLYGKRLITKVKNSDGTFNKTLLERFYDLKKHKDYSEIKRIFPVLEKILSEISKKKIKKNPIYQEGNRFGYNPKLNIDSSLPSLEKESYMNQFKQIIEGKFELEDLKVKEALINIIKDFFIAGIIQSGFNQTNLSFTEYAPVKFIQSLLNPALKIYDLAQKNDKFFDYYLEQFSEKLKINNSQYFFVEPNYRVDNTHFGKYLYIPDLIAKPQEIAKTETNKIYSLLGNKTKSENVIIKPWSELKDAKRPITPEGIISTRIKGTEFHFGNPFSHDPTGKTQGLIKTNSIQEAVERYINWILTGETGEKLFDQSMPDPGDLEMRRESILEDLKSGELKGKSILYFKELEEPSHATALDYLINKYNWDNLKTETKSDIKIPLSEYTNHSGGALGADTEWDNIGKEFGMVKNNHYWMNNKTPQGNTEISEEDKIEGQQKVTIAARQMGRIEQTHQVRQELLIRNWSQVKYADAVFAITTMLSKGDVMNYGKEALLRQGKGGTGFAMQMAINEGKPVYVFDQERKAWFKNLNGTWETSETPILTQNFAGIGTREINEDGKQAIRDVYEKTLENNQNSLNSEVSNNNLNFEPKNKTSFKEGDIVGVKGEEGAWYFRGLSPLLEDHYMVSREKNDYSQLEVSLDDLEDTDQIPKDTRFNTIENEVGTIINIKKGTFRLLEVARSSIYGDIKVLKLQSKSGLEVNAYIDEEGNITLSDEQENLEEIGFKKGPC